MEIEMMENRESVTAFLSHINKDDDIFLNELKEYASKEHVPIIREEMRYFVDTMLSIHKPKRILEIGCAIGYSSIMMAKSMKDYLIEGELGTIITIERSEVMVDLARKNIAKAGFENVITVIHQDAADVLKVLVAEGKQFDLIFMDAAKGQYMTFLEDCLTLLPRNGVLISDNVLQNGEVVKSRFGVTRRNRTIHQRMREYLWTLNHIKGLKTSILNIADGATISVKMEGECHVNE